MEQQTYLAVPYEKRQQAIKSIGQLSDGRNALNFDSKLGLWFAKAGTPLAKAEPWLPNPTQFKLPSHQDPVTEFTQVLEASGFTLSEPPIFDGQKHRVATVGDKRGQKSGVYCGYGDGHPAGWYQDHRNHSEPQKWHASFTHSDPLSTLHLKSHQANLRNLRQITEAKRYHHYANRCAQAFELMPHAKVDNPYLIKKDVQPFPNVMQDKKGRLVIPLMDEYHKVHSLQRISPNGFKCLKKGAQKSGHFFVVGDKPLKNGEPILYAEGYATAASIAEATNRSVVMTVDAGNMPKVGDKLKAHYPNSQHLFLADDDRNNNVNKGVEKAREAALLTNGHWLTPRFIRDQIEVGMTDFNDLHISSGLGSVNQQINDYIERCWPEQQKLKAPSLNSIEASYPDTLEPVNNKPANKNLSQQIKPRVAFHQNNTENNQTADEKTEVKPAVVIANKNQTTLPEQINKNYIAQDNKYYFSSRPKCLAFIDKGNKLQTKLSHAQVIGDLLSIAKERNWNDIKLTGNKSFKRQAWLQASQQGMKVSGYRPDKEDVKQLMVLQSNSNSSTQVKETPQTINQIEPVSASQRTTLQAAQAFCKKLQPEAQQRFMEKVKQKLDSFIQAATVKTQQPISKPSHHDIKESQHEQQLER